LFVFTKQLTNFLRTHFGGGTLSFKYHYNLGEPCILNAPLPQERSWDDNSKFGNFV